jgi:hypothetical protein
MGEVPGPVAGGQGWAARPIQRRGSIGEAVAVARGGWRAMLRPLLLGAVLPSLPVTGCVLQAHAVVEAGVADGKTAGLAQGLGIIALVILVPVATACGLLVTSSWIRAAWSAAGLMLADRAGDRQDPVLQPGGPGPTRRAGPLAARRRALVAYVMILVCLMAAGAAVPHLISGSQAPIGLENVTIVGLILAYAGPGLLTPVAFVAAIRAVSGQPPVDAARAGLVMVTLTATVYSLVVGLVLYGFTDILQADGFVLLMALAASLLAVPLAIFSISAGLASTAAANPS